MVMNQLEIKRCSKCILPETYPGIRFNKEGICNFCLSFEKSWGRWINSERFRLNSKKKIEKIFSFSKRKKREYDCLIPLSGGKDSLYVLYLCKKLYRLNILSITGDNGFLSPMAKENIELAIRKLKVDHVFLKNVPYLKALFRHFLLKTGNFCVPCNLCGLITIFRFAVDKDIPLVIMGLSRRTDPVLPDGANPWYFKNVIKDGFPSQQKYLSLYGPMAVIKLVSDFIFHGIRIINLPDYLEWDEEKISRILQRELGVRIGEEHSDCIAHQVADYLAQRRYGFGYKTIKYSLLIRNGFMNRDEALKKIMVEETGKLPASIDDFLKILGITIEDFHIAEKKAASMDFKKYYKGCLNQAAITYRKIFFQRRLF